MTGLLPRIILNFLDTKRGAVTTARFETKEHTKTERLNSKFWTSKTEAVDAFSQNWSNEHNWLVPPIYLIYKTIRHFMTCDKGT